MAHSSYHVTINTEKNIPSPLYIPRERLQRLDRGLGWYLAIKGVYYGSLVDFLASKLAQLNYGANSHF